MTTPKSVLILGGTSDIGFAISKVYAAKGWRIILAARDAKAAERNSRDLVLRHDAIVSTAIFDIRRTEDTQGVS